MNSGRNPKISIIIPTRERSDTLLSTIKTCTSQDYDHLEILVSDNFSTDATKDVVESFRDPRIRYVNTGRRVSMSTNWEFAFSHIDGGYVMFLGDDDGLMPSAASDLSVIIRESNTVALTWRSIEYGWPNCPIENIRDLVVIPLKNVIETRQAGSMLADVIGFKRRYDELPFLYKGLVKYEAVERVKRESGGQLFHSMIPDVYSGIALACVVSEYTYSQRGYTLNGASSHSNGTATFASSEKNEAERKFLSEDNIPFHPCMTYAPSIPILVTESLLQAREHFDTARRVPLDFSQVVVTAVTQATSAGADVFRAVVSAAYDIVAKNGLSNSIWESVRSAKHSPASTVPPVHGVDLFNRRALLDCTQFGVRDVYEASILCGNFLKLYDSKQLSAIGIARTNIGLIRRELVKRGWIG